MDLPKLIENYLQDIEDWGCETIYTPEYTSICESVLTDCKKLILESNTSSLYSLKEQYKGAPIIKQEIIEDFILYVTLSD